MSVKRFFDRLGAKEEEKVQKCIKETKDKIVQGSSFYETRNDKKLNTLFLPFPDWMTMVTCGLIRMYYWLMTSLGFGFF